MFGLFKSEPFVARGEPLRFDQEFSVGEARERIFRDHVPVYHGDCRPTTIAEDGRSLSGESFLSGRARFSALWPTSSLYAPL